MTRDAFAETIFVSDFDVVCNQNAFYSDVGFCSRKYTFFGALYQRFKNMHFNFVVSQKAITLNKLFGL